MSKKYKHKPPQKNELSVLRTKYEALSKEHETLQTALRMLTSTDRQTLLDAVKSVESGNTFTTTTTALAPNTQYYVTVGTHDE